MKITSDYFGCKHSFHFGVLVFLKNLSMEVKAPLNEPVSYFNILTTKSTISWWEDYLVPNKNTCHSHESLYIRDSCHSQRDCNFQEELRIDASSA